MTHLHKHLHLKYIGGEFITKIDVFFQRKDKDIPVLCQIREVVNGFQLSNNYHLLVNI